MSAATLTRGGLTAPQVTRATGASYRQVDYWTRTGLISPSLADPVGRGFPRCYSVIDAFICRLVIVLAGNGKRDLPRGGGIGSLARAAFESGTGRFLVLTPSSEPRITDDSTITVGHHEAVTVVSLDAVRDYVAARLEAP